MLVVTAVAAERDAVLAGINPPGIHPIHPAHSAHPTRPGPGGPGGPGSGHPPSPGGTGARVVPIAGGVGWAAGVAAAAELAAAATAGVPFDAVICAGIAGGFAGHAGLGDVVVADRVVAADLGAVDADGSFLSVDDLGLGPAAVDPDAGLTARLTAVLAAAGVPVRSGTVLTVATVTGTARRAEELAGRWSPAAEAMEGHPVALAAARFAVPFAEVRAISNTVGRRDRTAWDLPAAFLGLEAIGAALVVWTG